MFNLQFEEPYLSQAQAIMKRLCIKVDGVGDPKTYDVMKSFLNSAKQASKGATAIFNTDFGAETVTESYMGNYMSEQQTSIYATRLLDDNKALMLTTRDGAVFCCALVRVGDQDYLSIMNPQTAMEIREAMKSMVEHIKDTDKIKSLEQLTLWDRICNWFAQTFLDHPGEAVSRAEAYRNFYDGMQKHIDLLGRVEQAPATKRYKHNREYPEVDPNAQQNEKIQKNPEGVQQPSAVQQTEVKMANEEKKANEEEQAKEEEQVNEEEQVKEEAQPLDKYNEINADLLPITSAEFRKIHLMDEEGFGGGLNDEELQELLEEENAKIIAKEIKAQEEAKAKLREQKEFEEKVRTYEEKLQTREAALKERADKVATLKAKIKIEEDFINKWEPIYNERQERIDELNKNRRELDEYDMTHAGKFNRNRLVKEQEDLEKKIQKITDWMASQDDKKKFWDRKEAAENRIETTREAYEKAKLELEPLANQLRYEQLNLEHLSEIAQRDGAWMTPKEFLEKQYNQDKAQRDRKFAEEQKGRDEQITELEKELVEYEKMAKHFSKKLSLFSKTDEEKDQKAVYEKYVKDTKEKINLLKDENKQANKRHNEEDKAKQKELLSPSKELLEKTAAQLSDAKAKWDAAFSNYNRYASQFDQAKAKVVDKQDDHQKALDYYKDNFEGKTVKFDAGTYRSAVSEKLRQTHALEAKRVELDLFDAKAANYEKEYGEILTKVTPLSVQNADLEIKIGAAKSRLDDFRGELAEVDVDIAPLDMEDPRKASQQNKQNEKNEPQKLSGGLGMGGL